MTPYSLIVFDWDGTLVDSIERIVTSLQFASRKTIDTDVTEQQAKDVIGLGLMEAITMLHPQLDPTQHATQLNAIADAYRRHYLYSNDIPAPLFDGVRELLDDLIAQGYTLAIATGKSRAGLQQSIDEHRLADYFRMTRCASESRSKPHPEMLLQILHELDFSPRQSLMVGDSEHDLKMADNAAMHSIGVTHGVHDKDTLNRYDPLACLDDVTELTSFLRYR